METKIDLDRIERKAYLAYFRDGLWELGMGLCFLAAGLLMMADSAALIGAVFVPLYFGIWGMKRSLTRPRLGYVKFSGAIRRREGINRMGLMVIFSVTLLLGLLVFFLFSTSAVKLTPAAALVIFSVCVAGVLAWIGFTLRVMRFAAYGLLFLLLVPGGAWLGLELPRAIMIYGVLATLVGAWFLATFLRDFPRLDGEGRE